ncbi:hypothetical protein K1719_022737 [Acacia pycnantha]|nr:hypothetical protein K1719_022737 [Acacia pycnantha]
MGDDFVRDAPKILSFKDKLLNHSEEEDEDIVLNQGDISIGLNEKVPTVDFSSHVIDTLNKKMGLLEDLDYQNALLIGPWMIFGHYLTVQPWTLAFKPHEHVVNQMKLDRALSGASPHPPRFKFLASWICHPVSKELFGNLALRLDLRLHRYVQDGNPAMELDVFGGIGRGKEGYYVGLTVSNRDLNSTSMIPPMIFSSIWKCPSEKTLKRFASRRSSCGFKNLPLIGCA